MSDSEKTPEELGAEMRGHKQPSDGDNDEPELMFEQSVQQLEGIRTELSAFNAKIDNLIDVLEGLRALNGGGNGSGGGSQEDASETDTGVTIEHDYDADQLENDAYDWIAKAADFHNDLIQEPVEIEFGQVGMKSVSSSKRERRGTLVVITATSGRTRTSGTHTARRSSR